jgi:DNA-binding transcriptional ArsR family regulator
MKRSNVDIPAVFGALSDPTRFAIIERLLQRGPMTAGEIAEPLVISKPAVSRHLRVLEDAGIITRKVERQYRVFRAEPQALKAVEDWVEQYRRFWNQSFDRLEKLFLDKAKKEPRQ